MNSLRESLKKNKPLDSAQLTALGFQSNSDLIAHLNKIASKTLENHINDFHLQNFGRGYQTTTTADPRYGFVIKILAPYGDRPKEESIQDFKVAQKCGGGIVTPFFFLTKGEEILGLVAKKVEPIDNKQIKSQGESFVAELLNLYEQMMKQGFFDCDLILGNYGRDNGRLVNLDFGWSKDLWDDRTFIPASDLHWDAFHMGVHKFRETANKLENIAPGLGNYLLDEVKSRYGIEFNRTTIHCPRKSADFVPLAEKLREVTKSLRANNQKPVYPLVGEPIDTAIYTAIKLSEK